MKYGVIREGKIPSDSRVVLTPSQCASLIESGNDIVVQKSEVRAYSDQEYEDAGVPLVDDVSDCDVLIGVKEVPISQLIPDKTYLFFSHTIKEQAYNRDLLRHILDKNIRLIDYEVITDDNNQRLIAFGKFAGMVGAHNALWTYGKRTGEFDLPRLYQMKDYNSVLPVYKSLKLPNMKIALSGTGRVAQGAAMVLEDMGIKKVSPLAFVTQVFDRAVYTQIHSFYYAKRKDGLTFDDVHDFYNNPSEYESDFSHFLPHADIFINGIYWDNNAPAFFTKEQMRSEDFKIKVIADVTCDIAPVSSIPSTLEATTIEDPVFGYDPVTEQKCLPFMRNSVDMMTIDNLPNELPRDASKAFGEMFIKHVFQELDAPNSDILLRATVADKGQLGPHYQYLRSYITGA